MQPLNVRSRRELPFELSLLNDRIVPVSVIRPCGEPNRRMAGSGCGTAGMERPERGALLPGS